MPGPFTLLRRCKKSSPLSESSANALLLKFGFSESLPYYQDLKNHILGSDYDIKNLKRISNEEKNEFSYLCYTFLLKTYPQRRSKILSSCAHFFELGSKTERIVTPRALSKAVDALAPKRTTMQEWLSGAST
jgi:hypothetical protein